MRKPTASQFFTGYACAFIAVQYWGISSVPPALALRSFIGVNVLFILMNLIGTSFAALGMVPWREDDRADDIKAGRQQRLSRMMTQPNPEKRIVVNSSSWTGLS